MKINKLIAVLLAFAMLPVGALAADTVEIEPVDLTANKVVLKGTLDSKKAEEVMLVVVMPNEGAFNWETGTESVNKVLYQAETVADEDGTFSFEFEMNEALIGSKTSFPAYIKAGSMANPLATTVYFASESTRMSAIQEINDNKADASAIVANFSKYAETFGLGNMEALQALSGNDSETIAEKKTILENIGAENFATTDDVKVQAKMEEEIILAMYNAPSSKNRTQYIADTVNGTLKNAPAIGLEVLNSTTNAYEAIDAYSAYTDILNSTGREAVLEDLQNTNAPTAKYSSYEDIIKALAESVILNGVAEGNYVGGGADHITNLLTAENDALLTGLDLSGYLNSNKSAVNSELLSTEAYASLQTLQEKLNVLVAKYPSTSTGGTVITPTPGGVSDSKTDGVYNPTGGTTGGTAGSGTSSVFSDVSTSHWAYTPIMSLYNDGVISGFPGGIFSPDGKITREQSVKMLCEAFGIGDIEADISFGDVVDGAWYAKYIRNAVGNGAVKGITTTYFGVGANISRQDFAVIMYRILGEPAVEGELTFSDASMVAVYARNAIIFMTNAGIMNGYPDGTIRPTAPVSRAEAAKMIYNCIKGEI